MTQHSEHTSQNTCGSLTCLRTDIYKWKRLRSLTIYKTLPRVQDRSWGNKLNVEVHAELLVRLKSLCKNINSETWVQVYPARLTSELATYASLSTKGMVEFNCSKPALTRWLSWTTTASNSFEVAHTSPHIHHINTPLWIRSRLPTRTPSIALTLILRILEYPLSLVYELCKGSKFPYPSNPAIRIDDVNPAGLYFFIHVSTT